MRKSQLPGEVLTDEQAQHFAQFFEVGYWDGDRRLPLLAAIISYLQGKASAMECARQVELTQQTFRAHAREFLICGLLEMSSPNIRKLLFRAATQQKKAE